LACLIKTTARIPGYRFEESADEICAYALLFGGGSATSEKSYVIVFSIEIRTATKRQSSVLKTLRAVLGPTKAAPGCLAARLYSSGEQSKAVLLLEEWQSREDFDLSLYPARIEAICEAIGLSTHPPIVRLDTVERHEVLDWHMPPSPYIVSLMSKSQ
jgi:quinol monooxygenase YgiN